MKTYYFHTTKVEPTIEEFFGLADTLPGGSVAIDADSEKEARAKLNDRYLDVSHFELVSVMN